MNALFGTAGTPDDFKEKGYKSAVQVPGYIEDIGLDAFEYQCGRGVNVSEATANAIGKKAIEHGIKLSLHTPYYISLSSVNEETRLKSIDYILQSAKAAKAMGADRIVVHSGSCGKMTREEALTLAKDTIKRSLATLDENGLSDIIVCPETMGKINQLGDADEVVELCKTDERLIPTIDFGHLNARTHGGIKTIDDYAAILDKYENALGHERTKVFHSHFSKIEYSAGGEVCHLTFADNTFGPDFEPLMELIYKRSYSPVIISESAGTQGFDALAMKKYYISLFK